MQTSHNLPVSWLKPLLLRGGRGLPSRVLPGPMEGITAGSFCRVMTRLQLIPAWITPFIRVSRGVPRHAKLRQRLVPFEGRPTVVQLMGTHIPTLCGTAQHLAELGVIGVDLNCACPSKVVIAGGAGGACLRRPSWIQEALCALRQACPGIGISVKIRSGFADAAELPGILAAVRAAAPDFVILHFRTVAEQYRVVPDGWVRLAQARDLLPDTQLIGSGDLWTPADALRLFRESRVDGVAPARGLIRNPWLLRDIETACRGETPPARSAVDKLQFLSALVSEAEATHTWRSGFVLELTRYMFGLEHPLFALLAAAGSAPRMSDVLTAALRQEAPAGGQ